ncbi:MAG TPA: DUF4150 domain-containing protein [Polyangia bacterium]|nr:DUF4150 domain-containing protein [Polyangia bacterium]
MPDNVFANGRAVVYGGSQGQSVAFPDVCLCPPTPPAGPVPTPLPNTVQAPDLKGGAATVLTGGKPTGKKSSYFAKSTGNEIAQSTGGGVVSHTVQGKAYFQSFSPNVFIEGEPVVRHLDMLTQNHLAQPGNTPPAVWMSAMSGPAAGDPGPSNVVKKSDKKEGKATISVQIVDEFGQPVETRFQLTTPNGQKIDDRFLWGGSVTVTQLAKGKCKLALPEIDQQCRTFKRSKPAKAGQSEHAYPPGASLQLETGTVYRVVVPTFRTLWVEIPRFGDDPDSLGKQRFTLKSDDGQYQIVKTAANDPVCADDVVTLEFPGIIPGPTYTLQHQGGGSKGLVDIFTGQTFESLFPDRSGVTVDDGSLPVGQASGHSGAKDG